MKNFQDWLQERKDKGLRSLISERASGKTKLNIFDFDATLFNTHTPEVGKALHQEKTGKTWPYQGWWGRAETLEEPFASEIEPNREVAEAFKASKADPAAFTVLLTGRQNDSFKKAKMVPNIHALLLKFGLIPDLDIYKEGGSDTYTFKEETIRKILDHSNIKEIQLYDDRTEHVFGSKGGDQGFIAFLKQLKEEFGLTKVIVHHVQNGYISSHPI